MPFTGISLGEISWNPIIASDPTIFDWQEVNQTVMCPLPWKLGTEQGGLQIGSPLQEHPVSEQQSTGVITGSCFCITLDNFQSIILLSLPTIPWEEQTGIMELPTFRWIKWASEKLNNFSKITRLMSSGARISQSEPRPDIFPRLSPLIPWKSEWILP